MNKLVILFILLSYTLAGGATEDSVVVSSTDKQPFFKRIIGGMYEFVKDFSRVVANHLYLRKVYSANTRRTIYHLGSSTHYQDGTLLGMEMGVLRLSVRFKASER